MGPYYEFLVGHTSSYAYPLQGAEGQLCQLCLQLRVPLTSYRDWFHVYVQRCLLVSLYNMRYSTRQISLLDTYSYGSLRERRYRNCPTDERNADVRASSR